MAGTDRFEIDVKGVGGHAAQPEHCVDALVEGAAIVDGPVSYTHLSWWYSLLWVFLEAEQSDTIFGLRD